MNTNWTSLKCSFNVPYTFKEFYINSFILINNLKYNVPVRQNKLNKHSATWPGFRNKEGGE